MIGSPKSTHPGRRVRDPQNDEQMGKLPPDGHILLNPELIVAPLPSIEYVVIHELVHVRHHNHGPDFYRLLTAMIPDWETRRERLNQCVAG